MQCTAYMFNLAFSDPPSAPLKSGPTSSSRCQQAPSGPPCPQRTEQVRAGQKPGERTGDAPYHNNLARMCWDAFAICDDSAAMNRSEAHLDVSARLPAGLDFSRVAPAKGRLKCIGFDQRQSSLEYLTSRWLFQILSSNIEARAYCFLPLDRKLKRP